MTAPSTGPSADRLALLYRISETFNSSLDPGEVLNRVIDEVISVMRAERGFLMLRDADGQLIFRVARGMDQHTLDAPEFQISRGLVERVAREGRPRLISDARSEPWLGERSSVLGLGLCAVLCVPLQLKGAILGVVYVENRVQPGNFTPDDLDLLTAIASSAAVAIENARLHEIAELRREIDSPYIVGVPLTEKEEIFVGRADISARIEQHLLDRRRPPLLLYGQRHIGKTSLLNRLGRLLPSTIVPMFVDLQGPASHAVDHAGFLYNIARRMIDSADRQRGLALPPLTREALAADPFTCFDEWLDQVEQALGEHTALLALDEFEALGGALSEGRFDETAVLGMLRHLIQHRPRFKVLLAGSHTPDELQRLAAYLINVQVVQIGYLKEPEVRQLVERPVEGFALRYEPDASQRVIDLSRGHPFLVQLLCAEIVALKNEQSPAVRQLARLADVEAAVPEALNHGIFFFTDLQRNQVDAAGLAVLRFLAAQGQGAVLSWETLARQFPAELDHALALLARRELIESVDEGYRFQVELIRRWFVRRETPSASLRGQA